MLKLYCIGNLFITPACLYQMAQYVSTCILGFQPLPTKAQELLDDLVGIIHASGLPSQGFQGLSELCRHGSTSASETLDRF